MRRLLSILLLTAACLEATPTVPDLSDRDVQAHLGSPSVTVRWQRPVATAVLSGTTAAPIPDEVELIAGAIAELPDMAIAPRALLRVADSGVSRGDRPAVASASGPDILFDDHTFASDPTRLDLARAYAHELVHVNQWFGLSPPYVQAALNGEVGRVDLNDGSGVVEEFAAAVGWVNESEDPLRSFWSLDDPSSAPTAYAATNPAEDMAESVALAATGLSNWLDRPRATWVERWLGISLGDLNMGKPWIPAGSERLAPDQALYDTASVEALPSRSRRFDESSFELSPDTSQDFASVLTNELTRRGFGGVLGRLEDPRVPRFAGAFTRPDGVIFWVEFWDFRLAEGVPGAPAVPVLTYVILW